LVGFVLENQSGRRTVWGGSSPGLILARITDQQKTVNSLPYFAAAFVCAA
jgi:hypothetical protein